MPEQFDEANLKMILAFVAGLFSLLGACLGSYLARRTEYEKWLRQNRSEVFARFLEHLASAQIAATNAMYEVDREQLQRDIKVSEAYLPVNHAAKIVRLYLPKAKRNHFEKLAHQVFALHSNVSLGSQRLTEMEDKRQELQEIFEATLGS